MTRSRVTIRPSHEPVEATLNYLKTLHPGWYHHGLIGVYNVYKVYIIE